MKLVNIYAPNEPKAEEEMLDSLMRKVKMKRDIQRIIILEDFSSTEETIDRMPHRNEETKVIEAMQRIKISGISLEMGPSVA